MIAIAEKDLRSELRSRQLIASMGLFALLATMVFHYTLENRADLRLSALPSVLWVTVIFAGTLGLNRNLAQEHDKGSLDGLLLAPIDRAALFYGKFITTWLFTLAVAAIVTVALFFLFNTDLFTGAWWLVLILGTVGFAAVGTLLGSMAVHARGRETTFPILILPVALPIIMAAVSASNAILAGSAFSDWAAWLAVLASSDIIYLVIPLVLFEFIVEE